MRISEIHLYQKDLPVKGAAYTMAQSTISVLDSTIVKLVADNGLIGWGETCPLGPTYQPAHAAGARAAIQTIAPQLIGQSALTPNSFYQTMAQLLNGHLYAKAALDIALLDLIGRQLRLPVCDVLGGQMSSTVPSYYALGIGAPDEVARLAREKVRSGYRRLQLKIGGRPVSQDIAVLRKVFEAVGNDVQLVADANRSLTARDALLLSTACQNVPFVLEQPCNSLDEVIAIRHQLSHPIYLDESATDLRTVSTIIGMKACDGFGLKMTRIGGLTPFRAIRALCDAHSLPHTCDDSWGGDIIAAACVHAGATVRPQLLDGVWIAAPYIDGHYDAENGIRIQDGTIPVPTGFGLGISPDESLFGVPIASFG